MKINLENAIWVDVNTQVTVNTLPDHLPDSYAIEDCSLYNLFNCMPGQRARTFQPEYGSLWYHFLQEPLNDVTAAKMQIFMLDSIKKWEPRITVDTNNTYIMPDLNIPGYIVNLSYSLPNRPTTKTLNLKIAL